MRKLRSGLTRQRGSQAENVIAMFVDVPRINIFAAFLAGDEIEPCTSFERNKGGNRSEAQPVPFLGLGLDDMVVSFVEEDRGEAVLIGINLHGNDYLSARQIEVFRIAAEKLMTGNRSSRGLAKR